ncbi:D-alanine--D-alanine ligase [Hirsutella rhossiliensis]|uniref:D-alanine--D-alanine ligase n=1 Tax=Hirsutella rhossiliensis TaxID=111463 RepID=A0A9P8N111_9HYPO|nr:D-alanine--D-alanine ligase [Hirsutella rhossiliensis]KAH0965698.1 D-alanine--D-alanine ligase [Hirsutella rhossiliensis]
MTAADSTKLNIALVFEKQSEFLELGYSEEDCADLCHNGEIEAICTTLEALGHHVTQVPGIRSLVRHLAEHQGSGWHLVFNMAEGFFGSARESQVPCLLEAYQIPFTFADAATLSLCLNKAQTKMFLAHHKIPTAQFVVVPGKESRVDWPEVAASLPAFPVFAKPTSEGSGKGIGAWSKVEDQEALRAVVDRLRAQFPGRDILLEPFLCGRDLSVSILGSDAESRVVGVLEFLWDKQRLKGVPFGTALSFAHPVVHRVLGEAADGQVKRACKVALHTWRLLNCRDGGRVDIRFDSDRQDAVPNVLEVNPIAGMLPGKSLFTQTAKGMGMSFAQVLTEIVDSAMRRARRR